MIRYAETESRKKQAQARIVVIGAGGAGSNAVNRMIRKQVPGVEFVVANTDTMALQLTDAAVKIQLGVETCEGLGAGGDPKVGRDAALENIADLEPYLAGSDMVFITAGMGGGTGTGAAPVLARAAKEHKALTVAVVTKPFLFEGKWRMQQAVRGIEDLKEYADTLLVIPNEKLVERSSDSTTIEEAFAMADEVLYQAVRGISDLITVPGYINLDFADVRRIMSGMGMSLMGTADADGENRVEKAIQGAVSCPLLESHSIDGATGILINITGGGDLPLKEVNKVIGQLFQRVDPEANIIWGYVFDEGYRNRAKVTVIATGFERGERRLPAAEAEDREPATPLDPPAGRPASELPEPPVEAPAEVEEAPFEALPAGLEATVPVETSADDPEFERPLGVDPGIRILFAEPVPAPPEARIDTPVEMRFERAPAEESEPAVEPEPPAGEARGPETAARVRAGVFPSYRRRQLAAREGRPAERYRSGFFSPHAADGQLFLRPPPDSKEVL